MVGSFSNGYTLIATGLLGFAFGSVALGAQSFGHEYTHRTLGLLLSQPMDRRRIFLCKLVVLCAMLVTLTASTLVLFHDALQLAASPHTEPRMLVLAAACGLFVAPWLTMLCRSTIAAVVFTIAIPGLLRTAADVLGGFIYGLNNVAAIDRFTRVVFWQGMVLICAVAAVAAWRTFTRLEVIEGHGADIQLPESLPFGAAARATPQRSHVVWALLIKELRLQQIIFVVAALFYVLLTGLLWVNHSRPDMAPLPIVPITLLYAGIVAILIGSQSSAQERHLGTLEWQILLPVPAATQWIVKVGVAWGLSVVLGFGMPVASAHLGQSGELFAPWQALVTAVAMIGLTTGSLYVSSLCRSAMGALVLSFPSILATVLLVRVVGDSVATLIVRLGGRSFFPGPVALILVMLAVAAGLIGLLLSLAFRNHCSADRSAARTAKQAMAIAGYITLGLVLLIVLGLG